MSENKNTKYEMSEQTFFIMGLVVIPLSVVGLGFIIGQVLFPDDLEFPFYGGTGAFLMGVYRVLFSEKD